MAFSKARRLGDLITANAQQFITSAHITDTSITPADLHSSLNLVGKTVSVQTATAGSNGTAVASTAFVQQELAALVDSAPGTLNTLNELAAALGDDANFSTTITNSIATKLPLAGGTMTGALVVQGGNANNTSAANTISATGSQHVRLIGSTSSSGGHRASLVLASNGQETILSTTGSNSDLTVPTGDFILDVAGGIVLDADDSGTVSFKDAGTRFGVIQKVSNNFVIHSMISDGDIVFRGNDGGSTIAALTLDMSAAGKAVFNSNVDLFDSKFLRLGNDISGLEPER